MRFSLPAFYPGTPTASVNFLFAVPCDCVIEQVSVGCDAPTDWVCKLGSSRADAVDEGSVIPEQSAIGQNKDVVVYTREHFTTEWVSDPERLHKGDKLVFEAYADGGATAPKDLSVMITFYEG
jgi:hypothetical protein